MNKIIGRLLCSLVALWLVGCGSSSDEVDCGSDQVCLDCLTDPRPPWCYADQAKTLSDPDMCAKIKIYWGEAAATVGDYCVYDIAKATHDCTLCDRIEDSSVNSMCQDDCG
jgi:hypothetical protein